MKHTFCSQVQNLCFKKAETLNLIKLTLKYLKMTVTDQIWDTAVMPRSRLIPSIKAFDYCSCLGVHHGTFTCALYSYTAALWKFWFVAWSTTDATTLIYGYKYTTNTTTFICGYSYFNMWLQVHYKYNYFCLQVNHK